MHYVKATETRSEKKEKNKCNYTETYFEICIESICSLFSWLSYLIQVHCAMCTHSVATAFIKFLEFQPYRLEFE